jgi:excisionase family DNA binding protein
LLTITEAAARLAIDQKTLRRKIAAGDLPALRIGSGPQRRPPHRRR